MSKSKQEITQGLLAALGRRERRNVTELLPVLSEAAGGAALYVEEMTGRARRQWRLENIKGTVDDILPEDADARLVIACLAFEDGTPVFDASHKDALLQYTSLTNKLAVLASAVNGFGWRPEEPLKNGRTTAPSTAPPAPAE